MASKGTLKKILTTVIENMENGNIDEVEFYSDLPESLFDIFDEPERRKCRSKDEYLAVQAIQYPELHALMREFVSFVASHNHMMPLWDAEEHVGGAIARELALHSKEDVPLFARFITSNDLNHEVFQNEDMQAVVDKWGPGRETYCVVVARWLTPGQHRYEFNYDAIIDSLKSEADVEVFMEAAAQWFNERWHLTYTIGRCCDDVVEMLVFLFENLHYTEEQIREIIDRHIQELPQVVEEAPNENGQRITIQDKKTLETVILMFDTTGKQMAVNAALVNPVIEYGSAEELQAAVSELEARCRAQGYGWEAESFPGSVSAAMIESITGESGDAPGPPMDILSLFTPAGEQTPGEKAQADLHKGQPKTLCRKLQLYKSFSSVTVLYCDLTGLRMLDSTAYEAENFWTYGTEEDMLAALEQLKNSYLAKGYELVLDQTIEHAFEYTLAQTRQMSELMQQQKALMAEYGLEQGLD